ncbi:MAG TPA: fibronectin type III domain-containing protein [Thermoanaerobaculaceae bacterium]|nr:fibronectin type III domain-containing protein [Thermoanaerobaculaceae bacterium]
MRRPWRLPLALMFVALAACGRKLPPLPPIIEVPETTTNLTAYQDGTEVVLSWSYPQLTRGGQPLTDLARVEVWRLEVPPGQEQVGTGPQGEELRHQLMLGRGTLAARLEGPSLQAATRGSSLTYRDALPAMPTGTSLPTLWYAVRSRRKDGTPSALSNIVSWEPRPVPPTPTGLQAKPQANGIALCWDEVPGFGYVVERRASPEAAWEVISPLGIDQPSFLDTTAQQERTWSYRVRSFLKLAASAPSAELEVPYPDVYPPERLTSFICLPEPGQVQLRWEPSLEPNVTYKVFRRQGEGGWAHLEEAFKGTEYIDTSPAAGDLEYAVKVVDAAGNQSDAVYCKVRTGA